MRTINYIRIKNGKLYKDTSLRLDSGRAIAVYGNNTNGKQSNAAGKSLFFAYLYLALYGNPPLAPNALKGNRKALLQDNTQVILGITVGTDKYRVTYSLDGYEIQKNGIAMQHRTQALAEEYFHAHVWTMPEEFFTSCCYLSSQREFSIQRSPDTQRLTFFERLFQLDGYALLQAHFKEQLKALTKDSGKLDAYEAQLLSLKSQVTPEPEPVSPQEFSKLSSRLKSLSEKLTALEQWEIALRECQTAKSLAPKQAPQDVSQQLAQAQKQERQYLEYKEATAELRTLEKQLKECKPSELPSPPKPCASWQEYASLLQDYKDIITQANKLKAKIADLSPPPEDLPPKHLIELGIQMAEQAQRGSKHARHCLLCRQTLPHEHDWEKDERHLLIQLEQAECRELQKKLESLEEQLPDIDPTAYTEESVSDYVEQELENAALQQQRKRLSASIKKLQQSLPDEPSRPDNLEELQQLNATYLHESKAWKVFQRAKQSLADTPAPEGISQDEIADYREHLTSRIAKLNRQVAEKQQQIREYEIWASKDEALQQQINAVSEKIEQIQKTLSDAPVLEALIAAYSNKGLKVKKIASIAAILTEKLNLLAPLVYREAITFDVTPGNGSLSITATQNNQQRDVRYLSASESQRFNMLMPLALNSMLPASARTPLMILDEMVSNADAVTQKDFAQSLVPQMHSIIPNLIVISPVMLDFPDSVNPITATKRGDTSTLEGPPSLVKNA